MSDDDIYRLLFRKCSAELYRMQQQGEYVEFFKLAWAHGMAPRDYVMFCFDELLADPVSLREVIDNALAARGGDHA